MLRELSIRNFAIIDDLNIGFSEGLTILSGETGAGKSIIINAVNLLLGSRATSRMVRTGADSAELSAAFDVASRGSIAEKMESQGFDPSEGLIIRRVISRNDRHKVYINGRPATMQQLSDMTENLAGISGQHAHQGLLKEDQHLLILDQFGGLLKHREAVYRNYHNIIPLMKTLEEWKRKKGRQQDHLELLAFQKKEIEDACLVPDEDQQLEQERKKLKNSEVLYQSVFQVVEMLQDGQGSVHEILAGAGKVLDQVGTIDPYLQEKSGKVKEFLYGLEDVTTELRQYADTVQTDTGRLEQVEDRLDFIVRLKRKYGGSLEAVFAHLETVETELNDVGNLDEKIAEAEKELSRLHQDTIRMARELSGKRKQAAGTLAAKVVQELSDLKMPQTDFHILLEPASPTSETSGYLSDNGCLLMETGLDNARFLLSPNIGEVVKPLADIASGGELSRVVLALKTILAKTDAVETVVFDEVDAGIGGSVAEVVGKKLVSLAKTHQVICITHLAQIAKFGDHHFKIAKEVSKGRTQTGVTLLAPHERVEEIARMLGGETITRVTRDHAAEMLQQSENN
ncbi:MAG: DNA repair protein RecN [Pseudomonadota bacterium]